MKRLLTVAIAIYTFNSAAQSPYGVVVDLNDAADDSKVVINSVLFPNNAWQIGYTSKDSVWFGSGRLLITDTVSPYPASNRSAFTIKIGEDMFTSWSVVLLHAIDTDSARDRGYIELSSDNGATWSEISTMATFDFANSELNPVFINDTAFFTGSGGILTIFTFLRQWTSNWLYLRFVFQSDSIPDTKDGWAFLYIQAEGLYPENVDLLNRSVVALHPNPVENVVNVVSSRVLPRTTISICNTRGQTLLTMPFPPDGKVDVSFLTAGLYLLKISDELHQAVKPLVIVR